MPPKPSKEDYNTTKSYRPITLESKIGNLMEIIVKRRLVWKLEVEDGMADTQNAYCNNRSCTQSLMRAIQCIHEGMVKQHSYVMVVIDYESCFKRVWRAGLLKKAHYHGVKGRLWMYLKEFLTDRKYDLRVNNYTSPIFSSKVGIPQRSGLSPILCNLYTKDALEQVLGNYTEFADDASIWHRQKYVNQAIEDMNADLKQVELWCNKWNMNIA